MTSSQQKYVITDIEHPHIKGVFRIRAIHDIPNKVPKDSLGGYVQGYHNLEGSAWIYHDAVVKDNANVRFNAQIRGGAIIFGNATITGNAIITHDSIVGGNAFITGRVVICGESQISGNIYMDSRNLVKFQDVILNGHREIIV